MVPVGVVGVMGVFLGWLAPVPGRGTFTALDSASMAFFISEISLRRGSEGGVVCGWDVGLKPSSLIVVGDERNEL